MPIPFEATRSYVYQSTRYELLPRIAEIARDFGDKPFLLRDISKRVLQEIYTEDQLETLIKKAQSETMEKMRNIFGFYIPFLAANLRVFEKLGGGQFKNISIAEEQAEVELAEVDAIPTDNDSGFIYAYSFPSIVKREGRFPIKIGYTATEDASARVAQQCKATCCFEYPVVLQTWSVQRVEAVEDAIHSTLNARGSKRHAPGNEWFDTTREEIETIVDFIQSSAPADPRPRTPEA